MNHVMFDVAGTLKKYGQFRLTLTEGKPRHFQTIFSDLCLEIRVCIYNIPEWSMLNETENYLRMNYRFEKVRFSIV